ncbi:hypothetical protein WI94_26335 [Burkholderia vietnamiensis]|nr:hypothetical protein WI94_26335 [Burkholderia vietnamiensis]
MENFDGQSIDIDCAKCGHQISETIGRLKTDPDLVCPACGQVNTVQAESLREFSERLAKDLDELRRMFDKL